MSVGTKLLQAAAGNAGEVVYVDDVFSTFLYTGNGTNPHTITNGIDLAGEGGLIWTKARDSASLDNVLVDTERATGWLVSNGTQAASGTSTAYLSFNSDGYDIDNAFNNWNGSTIGDYVSWTFRKQEKFFDIVTYTGNGTAGRTISHNLGSVPGMMIVKSTSNGEAWEVYHRKADATAPEDKYLQLNSTGSVGDSSFRWNDTAPTATEFTVGGANEVNGNGMTYVAYLFAHNEQDFGENSDEAIIYGDSFVNNSASVGVEVNVGFEPQWLLIKGASSDSGLGAWLIIDNMRNAYLRTNNSNAEVSNDVFEFTSRGFKPLTYYDGTLIYVAIARPHKPASEFAATDLFAVDNRTTTTSPAFISGFPVDMAIHRTVDETGSRQIASRLTGSKVLFTDSVSTESTISSVTFDYMNGHREGASANADEYAWMWRRAKGYFDVVAYVGTGSATTVSHNLGVAPELILVKRRNGSADWVWYVSALGAGKYLYGDGGAELTDSGIWNNTAPTSSVFSVNNQSGSITYRINGSGDTYIAVLWATVAGISKVGSYTGTGSDLNVDCGFSAGARFVLIKRTDSSSDGWYVFDSVRGIVAGNDPYLLLNTTDTQVTNTDYIDPLSSGFTVTSSAPAGLNASSGTYIFLAIA